MSPFRSSVRGLVTGPPSESAERECFRSGLRDRTSPPTRSFDSRAASLRLASSFATCRGPLDVKTTTRTLCALAAFVNRRADQFLDQAFHRPAYRWMFSGQRGQRTSLAADHVTAVLFDTSHGAELLVEQLRSRRRHVIAAIRMAARRRVRARVVLRPVATAYRRGAQATCCAKTSTSCVNSGMIRLRQQLLDFRRELKHPRRSRRAGPAAPPPHHAVTFHRGDLGSDAARAQLQFGRDLVNRQGATLEKADDAPRPVSSNCCLSI